MFIPSKEKAKYKMKVKMTECAQMISVFVCDGIPSDADYNSTRVGVVVVVVVVVIVVRIFTMG